MGYSTFDNRIKSALDIAKEDHIDVDIIEEDGESIGQHLTVLILKLTLRMVVILKSLVFQLAVVQSNSKVLM